MKQVVKNYVFNAAAKTITLTDFTTVFLDRLAIITDATTNTILYNFTNPSRSTATVAGNVITLSALPANAQSTDKLRIDYDSTVGDPDYEGELTSLEIIDNFAPTNIFRDPFTSLNSANWQTNQAASDLIYEGGNVASASYVSICKSALVADTYSEIISTSSWMASLIVGAGLSLSQRVALSQHFSFDLVAVDTNGNIISATPHADVALNNAAGAVVVSNVVTFTTNTPHGYLPGDMVAIYGCTDPRMNVGETVVTSTPSPTTFTVANTIANATYTVGTNAFSRFIAVDNYATHILAHYFQGVSSTNDSTVSKTQDRQPEIVLWNPVSGASAAVVANENGINYSGLAYTDAFRASYEYLLRLNQKFAQFTVRNIDTNAVPGATQHRSHNFPTLPTNGYKVRFRARNSPNWSVPVGYITAAAKSGATTATLTVPNHGLTTSDWIAIVGIRDQVNFANQTAAVQVASVVDVNTITVVFGILATATSYGGFVFRIQGQQALPAITASSIQTYALTADSARLGLVFAATPSTPTVGEVWTVFGLVDSTNTNHPELAGRYKVALFNAATFTLELIPMDGQVISGAPGAPTACGGGLIKNSEFRIHFFRAETETPAAVEVFGGDGNADFANAIPVTPTSTPNVSTVTTVSNLGDIQWGAANVEPVYYSTGAPNSIDQREAQEAASRISFNNIRNSRWAVTTSWTNNFKKGVDIPNWDWLQQCPVIIDPGSSWCYDGTRYLYFAVQSGSASTTASTTQLYAYDTWGEGWGFLATLTSGNAGLNCLYDPNRNMVYIITGAGLTSWQAYNPNAVSVTVCNTACAARTVTTMAPILPGVANTGASLSLPSWGNIVSGGTLQGFWNDPQPVIPAAAGGSTTNVKTSTNQFTPTHLGMQVQFTSGTNSGKKAVITAVGSATSVTVAPALTGIPGAGDTFQIQLPVGTATSGTSTTLTDSTQGWTTNQYANSDVVITSGTGSGQRRRIASNTSTALTITAAVTGNVNTGNWSVTPDATSVYQIVPSGDFLYYSGANTTATVWKIDLSQTTGVAWVALTSAPATLAGGANLIHLKGAGAFYLSTLRGSGTATFYNYAIGPNSWTTPTTLFGGETFTTGSSYDLLEGHRKLFITKEAQNRCYTLDLTNGVLYPSVSTPYSLPVANDGQRTIHVTSPQGVEWIYTVKPGGFEVWRVPIEWGD